MKRANNLIIFIFILALTGAGISSCRKFSDLNKDPNSITPDLAIPDYLMTNVLTTTANNYGNWGSGNLSGAMQQTYQDSHGAGFSEYEWGPDDDWDKYYATLNDNKLLYEKAQANGWNFHQGVALVMRAFNFGVLTDFWGDVPYSAAVNGDQGSVEDEFPVFDKQQDVYTGIITDLKAAIPYFNGTESEHPEITGSTQTGDVFYGGDPVKWKKFAYSLLLRYYMRLSSKQNVQQEVEAIADSVFQSNDDDCMMPFQGLDITTSYQYCTQFNGASGFHRNKLCGTLTMKMKALKDPRIIIMGQPIATATIVDASKFPAGNTDSATTTPANGIRYLNPAWAAANKYKQFDPATYSADRPYGALQSAIWSLYDTSSVYVGIPISYGLDVDDYRYNLNGAGTQASSLSDYVSYLRTDIYDNPSGPLLAQRMASYSEICFDLAEAAQNGWNVHGTAATWYNKGIAASFDAWQVFTTYQSDVNNYYGCVKDLASYMAQPSVAFNGTLQQIIEQKWIAAWQACNEAYMDWRRTGYPAITVGWNSYRGAIPVRYAYGNNELQANPTNAQVAIDALTPSPYNGPDGNNSAWSKMWLIDGTGKPW
ncbi:MAG: SusD/RagB family nutrient-binding outer membrane lipoprotein [Chitinophagaceae bacterium]|nr:SusD/RagB family nutrient-binding outer membrane lipoprotein [Chitinophagaceae bacterium]